MPFSRDRLLRDCQLAADALEFARLGIVKGLTDRLAELRDSHLYRNHHLSAAAERVLFELREPGLVAVVDAFDAVLGAVGTMPTDAILADPRVELVELARAAAELAAALRGEAAATTEWLTGTLTELSY